MCGKTAVQGKTKHKTATNLWSKIQGSETVYTGKRAAPGKYIHIHWVPLRSSKHHALVRSICTTGGTRGVVAPAKILAAAWQPKNWVPHVPHVPGSLGSSLGKELHGFRTNFCTRGDKWKPLQTQKKNTNSSFGWECVLNPSESTWLRIADAVPVLPGSLMPQFAASHLQHYQATNFPNSGKPLMAWMCRKTESRERAKSDTHYPLRSLRERLMLASLQSKDDQAKVELNRPEDERLRPWPHCTHSKPEQTRTKDKQKVETATC